MKTKVLENIGFVHIANWQRNAQDNRISYIREDTFVNESIYKVVLATPSSLYAFCINENVMYIGRTANSIRNRFYGYRGPGNTRQTNARCRKEILYAIDSGFQVKIYAFTSATRLEYAGFPIDLAAGLEDSLIRKFRPPWNRTHGLGNVNGPDRGNGNAPRMSESAELEEEATAADEGDGGNGGGGVVTPAAAEEPQPHTFTIELGQTYYKYGFINPGVEASKHLGGHDEPVLIEFSDGTPAIQSRINRTANQNGSVRIIGNNRAIAWWFQANFNPGDPVYADVTGPHTIRLLAP